MSSEIPDYNVLTVAWINHRLQEMAEDESHVIPESPSFSSRLSFVYRSIIASVGFLIGKVVEFVVKPVIVTHR